MDELRGFIRIDAKENDVYKKLFSELKENEISVYSVEPERTFIKNKNIEIVTYPHYIRIDEDACEDIEELIEKYGDGIEYSECNLIVKYFIAFGQPEDISRGDSKVIYSDKDVIGKFDTFEEASAVHDSFNNNYSGLRPIVFFAEYYDLDADENEVLVCCEIIDNFANSCETAYAVVSANIIDNYSEEYGITCTLGEKLLEYDNLEEAQEIFSTLKSVYSGEKDLSELEKDSCRAVIENGMIFNIQETLRLFSDKYVINTHEPVLVKSCYSREEGFGFNLISRQIVDCIEEDNRY
ncbi:MAG: hypothetical protein IKL09_02410 [Clostridia bacterium]|nr:hypothetical protein [Clostridia bacterium]